MHGAYQEEQRRCIAAGGCMSQSFLTWHRGREYDPRESQVRYRGGPHQQGRPKTEVVACRYWFELTDGYWGQFTLTQLPHYEAKKLLPSSIVGVSSSVSTGLCISAAQRCC